MEYIEYYRIIKERIWLVLLGAGLAALAVIAFWLSPLNQQTHTARGRLLVEDSARREIYSQGDEVVIAYPRDERPFWATIGGLCSDPALLGNVFRGLNLPADAEERYKVSLAAGRLEGSTIVELQCSSTDPEISSAVVDGMMDAVDELWRPLQVKKARDVVATLKGRLPDIEEELREAEDVVNAIEASHGGMSPSKEAEIIENSLNAVQIALQSADLESAAARERSVALTGQPRRSRPDDGSAAQTQVALGARIDDLKQQVMEAQLVLSEMLARRTEDHPTVKIVKQQIASLERRISELEKLAVTAVGTSSYLEEAMITANTYAREMAKRQDILALRDSELRTQLSKARTDLIKYQEALAHAEAVQARLLAFRAKIAGAETEVRARESIDRMITVRAPAKLDPSPSGLVAFLAKLVLATLAGAALGVLAVFMLHYIDTTFKNEEEAARLLGYPILAGIPHSDLEVVTDETRTDQVSRATSSET